MGRQQLQISNKPGSKTQTLTCYLEMVVEAPQLAIPLGRYARSSVFYSGNADNIDDKGCLRPDTELFDPRLFSTNKQRGNFPRQDGVLGLREGGGVGGIRVDNSRSGRGGGA